MKKEFVIVVAIAVIMVSSAITVANMSDAQGQGNAQQYERNGITYFYDTIAESTISSSQVYETEISYDDGEADISETVVGTDDAGHAVLFTPPKMPWTLDKVKIYGKYGNRSHPPFYVDQDRILALEIWDSEYNLLYKLTDHSQAYFYDKYQEWMEIDIPNMNISGDFYVCFFERDSVFIGDDLDKPVDRSYEVQRNPNRMKPAIYIPTGKPLNYMIRAVGA